MRKGPEVTEDKVRETLSRILESHSFEGVERLKRFLDFVVTETLAGRGDQIKEFAVGEYAFGKGASFDPRNDPIVRVQARRLRSRLERYQLTEGQNDEILIDLPKGGYVPSFRRRDASSSSRRAQAPILLDRNSVLVLPFQNSGGDRETEQICHGIAEEIIHALTQIDGLTVYASAASQVGAASSPEASNSHNAATLITGSVQRRGKLLRVRTQVIDSATRSYQASDTLDREADENSFELQDEVAALMATRIRENLAGGRQRTGAPKNLAAHNLYLQGRYQMDQRTEESLLLAANLFEKALSEDGQFAKAHAGLADAYELMGHYGVIAPVEVWTKAPSSAVMAVLLDDSSVEAHTALAHVRSTQDWDWVGAENEFRRALELDPRSATAHHWYATACLAPTGRLDQALESIEIAHAISPLSSIISRDVASIRYYRREYDIALEQCDQAIELNPYFSQAYWTLGFIQEQRQDEAEALAAFNRALELAPGSPRNKGALGRMLALTGKKKHAQTILKELHQLAEQRYVSPMIFASLYLALDQPEPGYDWLKRAFQDRCFELLLIQVDPRFDLLRANPTFTELSAQLRLPHASTHDQVPVLA